MSLTKKMQSLSGKNGLSSAACDYGKRMTAMPLAHGPYPNFYWAKDCSHGAKARFHRAKDRGRAIN